MRGGHGDRGGDVLDAVVGHARLDEDGVVKSSGPGGLDRTTLVDVHVDDDATLLHPYDRSAVHQVRGLRARYVDGPDQEVRLGYDLPDAHAAGRQRRDAS